VKCLAIDETPLLIDRSLHELQIEIDNEIPDIGKKAYMQSQLTAKGHSFVSSKEFRLRFLRYELFDIQKSAIRMLKWLELSFGLFGSVALERPICISTDFSLPEQKVFRKGYIQLLPFRASGTGRRIICIIPYDEDWYAISLKIKLKILMYTFWTIGNDVDTQRKGVITIVMFDSSFHTISHLEGAGMIQPSDGWLLSVRTSAIHICTPDTPFFRLRRSFLTMAIGSHTRSRLKLHVGTPVELRYILQVYGIPIEFIPMTYTGKIKLSYVIQWLRLRNMIEDPEKLIATNANNNTNITTNYNIVVEAPYLNDVLFKQGYSFTSHPGNSTLQSLIESKVKQRNEINQLEKKALVLGIMDEIEHIHRSRFVYWHKSNGMSDCWWVLLSINGNINDQKVIFNKIEYLFRKAYTKKQRQKVIKTKHMKQQELTSNIPGLPSLHRHNNSTGNDDNNRTMVTTVSSSSSSYVSSSECFGMKFVPCYD
ncbi:MAG: hypothetical protein ACI90V_012263, partial [Bacillariaceae sp.]|jgi:hypothetical protein